MTFCARLRWVLNLWLLLVATTLTPLVTCAYDRDHDTTVAYDGNGKSAIAYDPVSVLATGEKENGTGKSAVFAKFAEFLAAKGADAAAALRPKLSALENAQQTTARTRTLPDGRVRYYGAETPARTQGPTRGASYVTEHNPSTSQVRSWMESYDQAGNVTRVHPKMIDGQPANLPHYPPTGKELGQ
jgi:hypothetical protein